MTGTNDDRTSDERTSDERTSDERTSDERTSDERAADAGPPMNDPPMTDPPYWRDRPELPPMRRLGAERRLLLRAGPHTTVVRPVLADDRLLLVATPDPELEAHLAGNTQVTLTPCDSRGEPRPARPFDVVDPVRTSLPAQPVSARVRPSPADARTALVTYATRHRLAAGAGSAVDTVRSLLSARQPPPLVLEATLDEP